MALAGCSFDATGGNGRWSGGGEGGDGNTIIVPIGATSDDGEDTIGVETEGEDETAGASSGSGEIDDCDGAIHTATLWAEEADVSDPMVLKESASLNDVMFVHSLVAGSGSATLAFTLPCSGAFRLGALVWDRYEGGSNPGNADSFYVSVDGQPFFEWVYGCTTGGQGDARWSWQWVRTYSPCAEEDFVAELDSGTHTLTFLNREAGEESLSNYAGLAAILVTNDGYVDPNHFYDPMSQ